MATTTEQSRAHENPADTTRQHGSNELVRLIRKLRWIGMEDEAERLQTELTRRPAAADSVLAIPRETD